MELKGIFNKDLQLSKKSARWVSKLSTREMNKEQSGHARSSSDDRCATREMKKERVSMC
jgi:hypothetical protein